MTVPNSDPYAGAYQTPTAPNPPPAKSSVPKWAIAAVAAVVGLCCLGGGIAVAGSLLADDPESVAATERTTTPDAGREPAPVEEADDEPEEPTGPMAMQVGDTGTYSEWDEEIGELTVTETDRFAEPRSSWGEMPDHDVFLLVTVNAVAVGDEVYDVSPYDFYLRDADGRRYEPWNGNALFAIDDYGLESSELNPGEQVTGDIVFDVPDEDLELVYAPSFGGRALAFWEIP